MVRCFFCDNRSLLFDNMKVLIWQTETTTTEEMGKKLMAMVIAMVRMATIKLLSFRLVFAHDAVEKMFP